MNNSTHDFITVFLMAKVVKCLNLAINNFNYLTKDHIPDDKKYNARDKNSQCDDKRGK